MSIPTTMGPHRITNCRPLREAGFTMIELLVAMVLFGIVAAIAIQPMLDGVAGTSAGIARSESTRVSNNAADLFRSDISAALSRDRDPRRMRDATKRKRAVTRVPFYYDADNSNWLEPLDVRDIAIAERNRIRFEANVIDEAISPGSECVEWRSTVVAARLTVTRQVFRDPHFCNARIANVAASLPAGRIGDASFRSVTAPETQRFDVLNATRNQTVNTGGQVTTIISNAPIGDATADLLEFTYDWLTPPGGAAGCTVRTVPAVDTTAAPPFNPYIDPNRILAVRFRFGAIIQRRGESARTTAQTIVPIESRTSSNYREMLGC